MIKWKISQRTRRSLWQMIPGCDLSSYFWAHRPFDKAQSRHAPLQYKMFEICDNLCNLRIKKGLWLSFVRFANVSGDSPVVE